MKNMFVVKILRYDPSSYKLNDFIEVKVCNNLKESQKFVMEKHYEIAYDNCDTDLSLDQFLEETKFEDVYDNLYETFGFEIEEVA
jgi:hypothetical protein